MSQKNEDRKYGFKYDPDVIKMLGENMYSTVYAALSELIANSHDAAAHNAWITIKEDLIIIEDDGNGMDYNIMNENFLRIAFDSRNANGENFSRDGESIPRMGRKGVGKLAALSLGKNARFYSKTANDLAGCLISLDDKDIVSGLKSEDMVFDKVKDKETGTIVKIDGLKKIATRQRKNIVRELQKRFNFKNDNPFSVHIRVEDEKFGSKIPWEIDYHEYMDIVIAFDKDSLAKFSTEEGIGSIINFEDASITEKRLDIFHAYKSIPTILKDSIVELEEEIGIKEIKFILDDGLTIKYKHEYESLECEMKFEGWIGTYQTLKKSSEEYKSGDSKLTSPENKVGLYSRNKLGVNNILEKITSKQVFESYIVGVINIDGIEQSNLPDIATSNRQDYREEDSRMKIIEIVTNRLKLVLIDLKKQKGYDPDRDSLEEVVTKTSKGEELKEAFLAELSNYSGAKKKQKNKEMAYICDTQDKIFKQEEEHGDDVIFISHRSTDKPAYNVLEDAILVSFSNITKKQVFCSSTNPAKLYENLFDKIAVKILSSVSIIYMLSPGFQGSMYTQQEVGAGWILGKKINKKLDFPMYANGFYDKAELCEDPNCNYVTGRDINPFESTHMYPVISDKKTIESNQEILISLFKAIEEKTNFKLHVNIESVYAKLKEILIKYEFFLVEEE